MTHATPRIQIRAVSLGAQNVKPLDSGRILLWPSDEVEGDWIAYDRHKKVFLAATPVFSEEEMTHSERWLQERAITFGAKNVPPAKAGLGLAWPADKSRVSFDWVGYDFETDEFTALRKVESDDDRIG